MILLVIQMKVLPEKRLELSQTIASLSGFIRMKQGCRRCDICQSMEYKNRFLLIEEWDVEENLITHLESEHFRIFQGATNLLSEPYEKTVYTLFEPLGIGRNNSTGKLKSKRRNTMKSSTKNQAEGKYHEVKGTLKEIAGELSDNPKLEAEGATEKLAGQVQDKIGQIKKALEK